MKKWMRLRNWGLGRDGDEDYEQVCTCTLLLCEIGVGVGEVILLSAQCEKADSAGL